MGPILGQNPSSIQITSKSIKQFLYNPADKPTNQQSNITSVVEVTKQGLAY